MVGDPVRTIGIDKLSGFFTCLGSAVVVIRAVVVVFEGFATPCWPYPPNWVVLKPSNNVGESTFYFEDYVFSS